MKTRTIVLIVGSMALLVPALYWGVAWTQQTSGASLYAPALMLGAMAVGAETAGPFTLVKGGHAGGHHGGHFRGFYGGFSWYPFPFYGPDWSYGTIEEPNKICVWNGYEYRCDVFRDDYRAY